MIVVASSEKRGVKEPENIRKASVPVEANTLRNPTRMGGFLSQRLCTVNTWLKRMNAGWHASQGLKVV